jgi:hypothetical protein
MKSSEEKQQPETNEPTQPRPEEELSEGELEQASGGIGSQSSGAGAGKITFNPFSITRKIDKASN